MPGNISPQLPIKQLPPPQQPGADSLLDDLRSILSEDVPVLSEAAGGAVENNGQYDVMTNAQAQLPVETAATGVFKQNLLSPERATSRFPGRDVKALQALAVSLARDCVYGSHILAQSIRSGRGGEHVRQLDPEKMIYIKHIIAGRVGKNPEDPEFGENVWYPSE